MPGEPKNQDLPIHTQHSTSARRLHQALLPNKPQTEKATIPRPTHPLRISIHETLEENQTS